MPSSATFLHVTDPHIAGDGTVLHRDDHKVSVPGIRQATREDALDLALGRVAEGLKREGRSLDGVLFSGDAQDRGRPGGHELLLRILLNHFGTLGITAARIVAVPGNHDVLRGSAPGSVDRYKSFVDTWRAAGCVTPWLDGVDPSPVAGGDHGKHYLIAEDRRWAILPINSSNWSNIVANLPEPLNGVWSRLAGLAANGDSALEKQLRAQLDALASYDMARVSPEQLEALRVIMRDVPQPKAGAQLRVAVLHHHLRAPGLREELKPFADVSNLEQVRTFLRDRSIDVVVHGHKHEQAAQFEHIYDDKGEDHRTTLVISGATFGDAQDRDAIRLITIDGLPATATVRIESFQLPRLGIDAGLPKTIVRRLWNPVAPLAGAPVVLQGTNIDDVYERACVLASKDADRGTLIVHLDLPSDDPSSLPLPATYPVPSPLAEEERQPWLRDLVTWWQLDRSRLEDRLPYVHGGRLRRFGGKIDQIDRIIQLLQEASTTRALAVLIDPFRDFTPNGQDEEFASFCLVEFKRREVRGGRTAIDCIAFYRAQEFARWWPINVAELRQLQRDIGQALGFEPGRITTVAGDARTISKSPSQVAMPIIDRWLDQAPGRLHLLANVFRDRNAGTTQRREAVRDWERSLSDLRQATQAFNPDRMAVPIEGLEMLAEYLEVARDEKDGELASLANTMRNLARHNRMFDRSSRNLSDFKGWSPLALQLVDELRAGTKSLVGVL